MAQNVQLVPSQLKVSHWFAYVHDFVLHFGGLGAGDPVSHVAVGGHLFVVVSHKVQAFDLQAVSQLQVVFRSATDWGGLPATGVQLVALQVAVAVVGERHVSQG